jgi:hypothetical protein
MKLKIMKFYMLMVWMLVYMYIIYEHALRYTTSPR